MANKLVKRQYIVDTKTSAAEKVLKDFFKWKKDVKITSSELFELFCLSDFNIIEGFHILGVISDEEYDNNDFSEDMKIKQARINELLKKLRS